MTLEKLGFVQEKIDNRVLFSRSTIFDSYREWIVFNLSYEEIDLTNINVIDRLLLEAITAKAKELFE